MEGLNTCTRFRAILARRRRRINSSLLPENIGPQITSIQPILPVIKSILRSASDAHAPAWSVFANHHSILNRFGIAFNGDGGYRGVWRGGRKSGEAGSKLVLGEFHRLARSQQLRRPDLGLKAADSDVVSGPEVNVHEQGVALAREIRVFRTLHAAGLGRINGRS